MTALMLFPFLTQSVSSIVLGLGYLVSRPDQSYADYAAAGLRFEHPLGMLAQNLAIAALLPLSFLLILLVHQVRPRWLSSVRPRVRWTYLWACLPLALVVLNLATAPTWLTENMRIDPRPGALGFLVVIVLTSPLQAAAEEYLFRGYLLQAMGSLSTRPWIGVVVSSVLFALFHGSQNLPLFFNRLAFGLLAATLVVATGGLEAGIAAHVANNLSAYVIAGLTGSISGLRATRTITWEQAGFDVLAFAVVAAVTFGVAKLMKVERRSPRATTH